MRAQPHFFSPLTVMLLRLVALSPGAVGTVFTY